MLSLLILTEAGQGIGLGHFCRCQSIKSFILKNGGKAKLLVYNRGSINTVLNDRHSQICDWLSSPSSIAKYKDEYDIILIDSYLAGARNYSYVRSIYSRVIVLDDYNRLSYDADLLINPNLYGDSVDYKRQKLRIAAGAKYLILREEIIQERNSYRLRKNANRILVTFGGDNQSRLIARFMQGDIGGEGFRIRVITGNFAIPEELLKKSNCRIYGYVSPVNMAKLMLDSDIVISGAGQTLGELAYLGIPAVSVCLGDDQRNNIKAYLKKGFISAALDRDDPQLLKKIGHSLELLKSYKRRQRISQIGRGLIGKYGVSNIIKIMESLNG